METYYGVKGNNSYLINKTADKTEVFVFDSTLGNLVNTKGTVAECTKITPCEIISVIPVYQKSSSFCEVYMNGYKKVFQVNPTIAIYNTRSIGGMLGTIFRVNHLNENNIKLFSQLLIVKPKGAIKLEDIDRCMKVDTGDWIPINLG